MGSIHDLGELHEPTVQLSRHVWLWNLMNEALGEHGQNPTTLEGKDQNWPGSDHEFAGQQEEEQK